MHAFRKIASEALRALPFSGTAAALLARRRSRLLPPLRPAAGDRVVELVVRLERIDRGRYLYSKLYYATAPDEGFSEAAVICFEVERLGVDETLWVELPEAALERARASGHLRLRVDGLPYAEGAWSLLRCRLLAGAGDPRLAAKARRRAHRQWVREQVLQSEAEGRVELPHYPESLSLELTTVCNLQCPHCSSHGMPHLHRHHNQRPEMPVAMLERLAEEAFPHASVVSLVGRGEPTLASDALWERLVQLLRRHEVRISCVTNGAWKEGRIDAGLLPWVHELIFSIDGASARTFALNRKGARLATVMANLGLYHRLRMESGLARRPQLSVSWTLKANNLEELPDFIDMIRPYEPDLLSIRHMVVFQDKERGESLLDDPGRTNRYLRLAYEKLDKYGIRHESPPLTAAEGDAAAPSARSPAPDAVPDMCCNWMHRTAIVMSDGEVTSCGKHYGAQVGRLDERTSFWQVWNGPAMRSLRAGFGTAGMWTQCRHCWLREIKWHSQRRAKDLDRRYSVVNERMAFSSEAWDYRDFSEL